MKEVQYLGHIISQLGIHMDLQKLEVIKEWPIPNNIHGLRAFIGVCAYYRCFIEMVSSINGPLHDLKKRNILDFWTIAWPYKEKY